MGADNREWRLWGVRVLEGKQGFEFHIIDERLVGVSNFTGSRLWMLPVSIGRDGWVVMPSGDVRVSSRTEVVEGARGKAIRS